MYYNNSGIPRSKHSADHEDPLRAKFTAWLTTTLIHAKYKFLENRRKEMKIISLEEIPVDLIEDPTDYYCHIERTRTDFEFEEERLAKAFSELPLMRREVLRLLFVDELTVEQAAQQLCCSQDMVRQQKSRAIRKLRAVLAATGEDDYE